MVGDPLGHGKRFGCFKPFAALRSAGMMWSMCSRALAAVLVLASCTPDPSEEESGDEIPECVEYELDGCMALYPATYDQVWTQTLANGCAGAGSSCHAQPGSGGAVDGMVFVDPQASFDHMIAEGLVVPGEPLCSPLFVRLATDDPAIRMPPGTNGISEGAKCSIGTWIANGAESTAP